MACGALSVSQPVPGRDVDWVAGDVGGYPTTERQPGCVVKPCVLRT